MRGSAGDVAVFWDLDTCPVHSSISGYEVVDKIRDLSGKLGTVKSFKAYADLVELKAPDVLQLRSELQSSGVSLIDCPAPELRSISSRTMIVDMLTYAADNPPPTTLFVIAGNDDLAYAISILRLRQYRIILACPKEHVGQHSQATLYLDWFHDVLGSDFPVADNLPLPSHSSRRPRSNTTNTAATPPHANAPGQDVSSHTPEQSDCEVNPNHPGSAVSSSHQGSDEHVHHRRESVDKWSEEEVNAPTHVELVPPSPLAAAAAVHELHPQEKGVLEQLNANPMGSRIFVDVRRPFSAPPSYSSFSPAPTPSSEDLYAPQAYHAFGPPQYIQNQTLGEVIDEPEELDHPVSQPRSPASTTTSTITPQNSGSTPLIPFSTPQAPVPDLLGPIRWEPGSPTPVPTPDFSPLMTPRTMVPSLSRTQTPFASPSQLPPEDVAQPTIPAPSSPEPLLPPTPAPPSTEPPLPPMVSVPSISPSFSPPSVASAPAPTPITTRIRPPVPKVIPSHFEVLVKELQGYRARGNLKPFRPSVAAMIMSLHGDAIQQAGASDFRQYVQLAEQAGIVELPGPEGGLWVALRPELCNRVMLG
ncbi:DUF537-domain-containing protein [Macrolepiota fuliginosa MF-IS2]|uniref:DUF537-domain-containing protein n=1 Tax=Macrolepiota fuliginosa MF-IS2 TaxID=1400762 RepID=A0A9P5XDY0_9AGAR|nr:DUF537-domain-containing protein [Macrolepiota fuliginosa MF-IS2]